MISSNSEVSVYPKVTPQNIAGFSLVELLISMTVIGILVAATMPNYKAFAQSNRFISQINGFKGTLAYARSEAIKRASTVTIQPLDVANWSAGWVISNVHAEPIRIQDPLSGNTLLKPVINTSKIQFMSNGRVKSSQNIVFVLCNNDFDQEHSGKKITLDATGHSKIDTNYQCRNYVSDSSVTL